MSYILLPDVAEVWQHFTEGKKDSGSFTILKKGVLRYIPYMKSRSQLRSLMALCDPAHKTQHGAENKVKLSIRSDVSKAEIGKYTKENDGAYIYFYMIQSTKDLRFVGEEIQGMSFYVAFLSKGDALGYLREFPVKKELSTPLQVVKAYIGLRVIVKLFTKFPAPVIEFPE